MRELQNLSEHLDNLYMLLNFFMDLPQLWSVSDIQTVV